MAVPAMGAGDVIAGAKGFASAYGDGFFTGLDTIVSTQTLPAVTASFTGTAQGVSSITWTWSAVTGATAYNLYQATSSTSITPISPNTIRSGSPTGASTTPA